MEKIFELFSNLKTPLALAGIFAGVLFFIIKRIIVKTDNDTLKVIINKLFILALVAMILGFIGFVIGFIIPARPDKSNTISHKISGSVIEGTTGKAVENATIIIGDSLAYGQSRQDGRFEILLQHPIQESIGLRVVKTGYTSIDSLVKNDSDHTIYKLVKINLADFSRLHQFVLENQYTPFKLFRTDWSVGTIVNYSDGNEHVIAWNEECLNVKKLKSADLVLSAYHYSLTQKDLDDLELAQSLAKGINLQAAFGVRGIKKIIIKLGSLKEIVASQQEINRQGKALLPMPGKQDCLNNLMSKDNRVIARILRADTISFSFLAENEGEVLLDGTIFGKLGLAGDLYKKFEGRTEFQMASPIILGYGLERFLGNPGMYNSDFIVKTVTPLEIQQLRAKSLIKPGKP